LRGVGSLDELQRAAPNVDLAVRKHHDESRRAASAIVACDSDAFDDRRECAPQKKGHAQRERLELKDEMFTSREDGVDPLLVEATNSESTIPADALDAAADERAQLLGCQMN
jgi:hypothetical protein